MVKPNMCLLTLVTLLGAVCVNATSELDHHTSGLVSQEVDRPASDTSSVPRLYGPSGKPEKEDFNYVKSIFGDETATALFAILNATPEAFLQSKFTAYSFQPVQGSNLPDTKSFVTITMYDKALKPHDIISVSPSEGSPWWFKAYKSTIWMGDNAVEGSKEFQGDDENYRGQLRVITGAEDVNEGVSDMTTEDFESLIGDAATTPICAKTNQGTNNDKLPHNQMVAIERVDKAKNEASVWYIDDNGPISKTLNVEQLHKSLDGVIHLKDKSALNKNS